MAAETTCEFSLPRQPDLAQVRQGLHTNSCGILVADERSFTHAFRSRRNRRLPPPWCRNNHRGQEKNHQGRGKALPQTQRHSGRPDHRGSCRECRPGRRPRRHRPGGPGQGLRGAARSIHRGADQLVAPLQGEPRKTRVRRCHQSLRGRSRPVAPRSRPRTFRR